jgi:hypothetical protein
VWNGAGLGDSFRACAAWNRPVRFFLLPVILDRPADDEEIFNARISIPTVPIRTCFPAYPPHPAADPENFVEATRLPALVYDGGSMHLSRCRRRCKYRPLYVHSIPHRAGHTVAPDKTDHCIPLSSMSIS